MSPPAPPRSSAPTLPVTRSVTPRHRDKDEHDRTHERREHRERPVPAMAAALFSPGLFDQRVDQGFQLIAVDRFALARRARWSSNGHGSAYLCASDQTGSTSSPRLCVRFRSPLPSVLTV